VELLAFMFSPHLTATLDDQFVTLEADVDLIAFESRKFEAKYELIRGLVCVTDRRPLSESFLVLEVGSGKGGLEQLIHAFLNAE